MTQTKEIARTGLPAKVESGTDTKLFALKTNQTIGQEHRSAEEEQLAYEYLKTAQACIGIVTRELERKFASKNTAVCL